MNTSDQNYTQFACPNSTCSFREIGIDPNCSIFGITPTHNEGILFANYGMRHLVTGFIPRGPCGERIILFAFAMDPEDSKKK